MFSLTLVKLAADKGLRSMKTRTATFLEVLVKGRESGQVGEKGYQ